MRLVLVRHAESTENATKNSGFYQNPRPWTGAAAHALSRDLVGLTPRGFRQCQWLRRALPDFLDRNPHPFTSEYRRARDTAELALPGRPAEVTALLNEQHYGDATYMTFEELFTRYPDTREDRQLRKHVWTPPGEGGESLAGAVMTRAGAFLADLDGVAAPDAVAVTHHTALLALRSLLERRPVTDLVEESRERKVPNGAVLVYERRGSVFHQVAAAEPDC
ncbi:histidine phosphatase family protein [Streptomyces sp. NPDC001584]|uniref:histidine phosphatase family protein n=1 Tax=Streptomyces sp. NPDC001584 TaxID=3154521 RepID=UPI003328EA7F